jgi:hypothetical protein
VDIHVPQITKITNTNVSRHLPLLVPSYILTSSSLICRRLIYTNGGSISYTRCQFQQYNQYRREPNTNSNSIINIEEDRISGLYMGIACT